MSTVLAPQDSISNIIHEMSGGRIPTHDFDETIKQVEQVKRVRFAWHPWITLPNFSAEGFRFHIPYPELTRLEPIPLPAFPYPDISAANSAGHFAFLGATMSESVPASGARAVVKTALQSPDQSLKDLQQAYGRYGMTPLASMDAADEIDLRANYSLYRALMSPVPHETDAQGNLLYDKNGDAVYNENELNEGRRPAGLTLEDFPAWINNGAKYLLRTGSTKGIAVRGQSFKFTAQMRTQSEQLLGELLGSCLTAHAAALDPSDGILPTTKKLLNKTANGGHGGKDHLDALDEWLLTQFPSYRLDTDVERAQKAVQSTMAAAAKTSDEGNAALLLFVQQSQAAQLAAERRHEESMQMMMQLLADKPAMKTAKNAPAANVGT